MRALTVDEVKAVAGGDNPGMGPYDAGYPDGRACANAMLFWGSAGSGLGAAIGSFFGPTGGVAGYFAGALFGGWFGTRSQLCHT